MAESTVQGMGGVTPSSTWGDYRARLWTLRLVAAAGLPVALGVAEGYGIERYGEHGLVWPLVAWMVLVACAALRVQGFICPRCSKRFFRRRPPVLALRARRCTHCMLPKDH